MKRSTAKNIAKKIGTVCLSLAVAATSVSWPVPGSVAKAASVTTVEGTAVIDGKGMDYYIDEAVHNGYAYLSFSSTKEAWTADPMVTYFDNGTMPSINPITNKPYNSETDFQFAAIGKKVQLVPENELGRRVVFSGNANAVTSQGYTRAQIEQAEGNRMRGYHAYSYQMADGSEMPVAYWTTTENVISSHSEGGGAAADENYRADYHGFPYITADSNAVPCNAEPYDHKGQLNYDGDEDTDELPAGNSTAWRATCALCGGELHTNFYGSQEAWMALPSLRMGSLFFYSCRTCGGMEQGTILRHACKDVSINRYFVTYHANTNDPSCSGYIPTQTFYSGDPVSVSTDEKGKTVYNYVYEGKEVQGEKYLAKNTYVRDGYTFLGWNTSPDGSGKLFASGSDFYATLFSGMENVNLPNHTEIHLYAVWVPNTSTVTVRTEQPFLGGAAYKGHASVTVEGTYRKNGIGTREGDYLLGKTDYVRNTLEILASDITLPTGYRVSFEVTGGIAEGDGLFTDEDGQPSKRAETEIASFSAYSLSNKNQAPYGNVRYLPDGSGVEYRFGTTNQGSDYVSISFKQLPIELPNAVPYSENILFAGWFSDSSCKQFVGNAGDLYYPETDNQTLYARFFEATLQIEDVYYFNDTHEYGNVTTKNGEAVNSVKGKNPTSTEASRNATGAVNLSFETTQTASDILYQAYVNKTGSYLEISEEGWEPITSDGSDAIDVQQVFLSDQTATDQWQSYTVPYTGLYRLQAMGAQGGRYTDDCDEVYEGGTGGITYGQFYLEAGEELRYKIGGQGTPVTESNPKRPNGGVNGGGSGYGYAGGGGYTVVTSDRQGVLLVSGGGGGAAPSENVHNAGEDYTTDGSSTVTLLLREDDPENWDDGQDGEPGSNPGTSAGGGGGWQGGKEGQIGVHKHTPACFESHTYDASNSVASRVKKDSGSSGVGKTIQFSENGIETSIATECSWSNTTTKYGTNSDDEDERWWNVKANYVLDVVPGDVIRFRSSFQRAFHWKGGPLTENRTYTQVTDQNGNVIAQKETIRNLRDAFEKTDTGKMAELNAFHDSMGTDNDSDNETDLTWDFPLDATHYIRYDLKHLLDDTSYANKLNNYPVYQQLYVWNGTKWVTSGIRNKAFPNLKQMISEYPERSPYNGTNGIASRYPTSASYYGTKDSYYNSVGMRYLQKIPLWYSIKESSYGGLGKTAMVYREVTIPEGVYSINIETFFSFDAGDAPDEYVVDWNGTRNQNAITIYRETKKCVCGYEEGQIVSSDYGYGGSNYVNENACIGGTSSGVYQSGQHGNGQITFQALNLDMGLMQDGKVSLVDVYARDKEKPDKIDESTVSYGVKDDWYLSLTWKEPESNGSPYWYYVAAMETGSSYGRVTSSPIVMETLTSAIAGYYYVEDNVKTKDAGYVRNKVGDFNTDSGYTWGDSHQKGDRSLKFTGEPYIDELDSGYDYVHIAPVDIAGNVGDTIHFETEGVPVCRITFNTNRLEYLLDYKQLSYAVSYASWDAPGKAGYTIAEKQNAQQLFYRGYYALGGTSYAAISGRGVWKNTTRTSVGGDFPVVTCTGAEFLGWNTQADGLGDYVTVDTFVPRDYTGSNDSGQEITLYAIWSDKVDNRVEPLTEITPVIPEDDEDIPDIHPEIKPDNSGNAEIKKTATVLDSLEAVNGTLIPHYRTYTTATLKDNVWSRATFVTTAGQSTATGIFRMTQEAKRNGARQTFAEFYAGTSTTPEAGKIPSSRFSVDTLKKDYSFLAPGGTANPGASGYYHPNKQYLQIDYLLQGTYYVQGTSASRTFAETGDVEGNRQGAGAFCKTGDMQIKIDNTAPSIDYFHVKQDRLEAHPVEDMEYLATNGLYTLFEVEASDYSDAKWGPFLSNTDAAGIKEVRVYVYDKNNPSDGKVFDLTATTINKQTTDGSVLCGLYAGTFNLYKEFPNAEELVYQIYVTDNAGNFSKAADRICDSTGDSSGTTPKPKKAEQEGSTGDRRVVGELDNFTVKTIIYNDEDEMYNRAEGETYFRLGDYGHVEVWTYGYTDGVYFDFGEMGLVAENAIASGELDSAYRMGVYGQSDTYLRFLSCNVAENMTEDVVYREYADGTGKNVPLAQHYHRTGWNSNGTSEQIPTSYEGLIDSGHRRDNGSIIYNPEYREYNAVAQKEDSTLFGTSGYVIWDGAEAGEIHYRVIHESLPPLNTGNGSGEGGTVTIAAYRVNYFVRDVGADTYTRFYTDIKYGNAGETVRVSDLVRSIDGCTYTFAMVNNTRTESTILSGNHSRIINLFYTRNTYTLTLEAGDGVTAVEGSGVYEYGQKISIRAVVLRDYAWSHWSANGNSLSTDQELTVTMPNKNLTYRANAAKRYAVITYHSNYKTGQEVTRSVNKANNVDSTILSSTTFAPSSGEVHFSHWNTKADGSGTSYHPGDIYSINRHLNLYAIWKEHQYQVSIESVSTCSTSGVKRLTCSCGRSYTEELPLIAHDYTKKVASEERLSRPVTCSAPAAYYYSCSMCGKAGTNIFYYGPVLDHQYAKTDVVLQEIATGAGTEGFLWSGISGESWTSKNTAPNSNGYTTAGAWFDNPTEITCSYQVDSEKDCDVFRLYIDGEEVVTASGSEVSGTYSAILSAGFHTFTARYSKDGNKSVGADKATMQLSWDCDTIFDVETPSCSNTGTRSKTCQLCGEISSYELTKLKHLYHTMPNAKMKLIKKGPGDENFSFYEDPGNSWWSQNTGYDETDGYTVAGIYFDKETTLTYDYWVSSEEDSDILSVYIDGVLRVSASGEMSGRKSVTLPAGYHTVDVCYSKDSSSYDGDDSAYVTFYWDCPTVYDVTPATMLAAGSRSTLCMMSGETETTTIPKLGSNFKPQ